MYMKIKWLTVDDMGVHGVTGAYIGTQGMCTLADRGSQGVLGLCTGADRGCTGTDMESRGDHRDDRGFSYEQGF